MVETCLVMTDNSTSQIEMAMKNRVSPTATNNLITALNSSQSSTTSIKYLFRNGADPWATSHLGSSVLDLCLRDGRHFVASAWAQAAREHLKKYVSMKNPMADARVVDLVAGSVYLDPQDRQEHLRKFLFKPEKVEEHHAFICKMFTSRNPQIWPVISSMLLLRPHLHSLPVPSFVDSSTESDFFADDVDIVQFFNTQPPQYSTVLIDEFVAHAPNQVLYNYLKDKRHVVNLDWKTNPVVKDRLRLFLSSDWAHQWKELPGFRLGVSGINDKGETALHHYLRDVDPSQLTVQGLEVLLDVGNSWHQTDATGVNCLTLINELSNTGKLTEEVQDFVEQSASPAQSVFRAFSA